MPPEAPASVPQRQLSLPQQIPIEIVILFFYFNESIVIHNIFIHHAVFKFYCFENQYKKIFIQNWIFCLNGRQSEKLHKNRYLKVLAQDREACKQGRAFKNSRFRRRDRKKHPGYFKARPCLQASL